MPYTSLITLLSSALVIQVLQFSILKKDVVLVKAKKTSRIQNTNKIRTPFVLQPTTTSTSSATRKSENDNEDYKFAFIVKDLYRGGGTESDSNNGDTTNDEDNDIINEIKDLVRNNCSSNTNSDDSGVNVMDKEEEEEENELMDHNRNSSVVDGIIVVEEVVSVRDDDGSKLKEQGIGDPSDSDGDNSDENDSDEDGMNDESEVLTKPVKSGTDSHVAVTKMGLSSSTEEESNRNSTDSAVVSYEESIQKAMEEILYLPPSVSYIEHLHTHGMEEDIASRKRLDRRTLYRMLLLELSSPPPSSSSTANNQTARDGTQASNRSSTSSSTAKRKFLDDSISTSLRAAVSLASQPKWRKHVIRSKTNDNDEESTVGVTESSLFYSNNIKLYPDDYSQSEQDSSAAATTTMSMQETIAMAIAHSLNCGFIIIDDARISYLKHYILNHTSIASHDAPELKTSFILKTIMNMLNDRNSKSTTKLSRGKSISSLMKEDYENQVDELDHFDELANQSYTNQLQDEITYPSSGSSLNDKLSCLFFIRTEDSSMLLRSKSAVDVLLKEMSMENVDSIHLFALGKNMDMDLLGKDDTRDGSKRSSSIGQPSTTNAWSNSPMFGQQQQNQNQPHTQSSPFYQMNQDSSTGNDNNNNNPNNMNNASGQNDPEGAKRVNIFLARTIDPEGNPGIIGTIAPPAAGNIFPQMIAMHQQRQQQQREDEGLDDSTTTSHSSGNDGSFDKMFFNTSLSPDQQQQQQQQPTIPPEILQRVIQQAVTQMIEQLSQLPQQPSSEQPPPGPQQEVIQYFSEMLQNEHLKRSVTDNLIRAAPALLDPRCQGIMLSVYIPPGTNHPNHGMMPNNLQSSTTTAMPLMSPDATPSNLSSDTTNPSSASGGGGWWNKILQPGATTTNTNTNTNSSQQQQQTNEKLSTSESTSKPTKNKENKKSLTPEAKQRRGLLRLSSHTQTVPISKPMDQVRARSWENWMKRQINCKFFQQNLQALQLQLNHSNLKIRAQDQTDDFYVSIKQLLSVRDMKTEMKGVVKNIIELEAAMSQRGGYEDGVEESTTSLDDTNCTTTSSSTSSLPQLFMDDDDKENNNLTQTDFIHPSTIESVLSQICQQINAPGTSGSSSTSSSLPSYRTKEEISSLAQDKHERALVSNVVLPQDIGINYDMIGGLNEVKELLRQSITYPLKYPHLYSEGIAREAVKGVLLFGPPGTGKTMLAKAVATEGGATFISIDASSVENKWLGESEKNAKAVFTLARRLAPCVIFLDEVDSLLSSREGSGSDDSAHGTLTSVKTTMMSEWDGLNSATSKYTDNRVIVIGSTNRPYDLDEAVLRRFPRRILVDLPDLDTRREILEVTLAENRIDASVNFTSIAELLDGYTGSDIKEVCREAVVQISHEQARLLDSGTTTNTILPTRANNQRLRPVTLQDFEKAIRKLKKSVSAKGKELMKVLDWNEEYGEIKNTKKKKDSLPQVLNMFL